MSWLTKIAQRATSSGARVSAQTPSAGKDNGVKLPKGSPSARWASFRQAVTEMSGLGSKNFLGRSTANRNARASGMAPASSMNVRQDPSASRITSRNAHVPGQAHAGAARSGDPAMHNKGVETWFAGQFSRMSESDVAKEASVALELSPATADAWNALTCKRAVEHVRTVTEEVACPAMTSHNLAGYWEIGAKSALATLDQCNARGLTDGEKRQVFEHCLNGLSDGEALARVDAGTLSRPIDISASRAHWTHGEAGAANSALDQLNKAPD